MYNTETTKYFIDGFRCGGCPASTIIEQEYGTKVFNDTPVTVIVKSNLGENTFNATVAEVMWPHAVAAWMEASDLQVKLLRFYNEDNDSFQLTALYMKDGVATLKVISSSYDDGTFRQPIPLKNLSMEKLSKVVRKLREFGFDEGYLFNKK